MEQEFIFLASHLEHIVEIYNVHLERWETEVLQDLAETVLYQASFEVLFKHGDRTRLGTLQFGWFQILLPEHPEQLLWILVADDPKMERGLVLITNAPLGNVTVIQKVYADWRLRGRIEQGVSL